MSEQEKNMNREKTELKEDQLEAATGGVTWNKWNPKGQCASINEENFHERKNANHCGGEGVIFPPCDHFTKTKAGAWFEDVGNNTRYWRGEAYHFKCGHGRFDFYADYNGVLQIDAYYRY